MSPRVVLTLDLGTSSTKAALWVDEEMVGPTRAPLTTRHPEPTHAEQDPESWWTSVLSACAALRARVPEEYAAVQVVVCSAARETFALFDAELAPIGPGILWSDHRAGEDAEALGDAHEFRRSTGVVRSPGSAAAKARWLARHDRASFEAARWLLAPRDLVVARLTGTVVTDPSLASRTGWYALDGSLRAEGSLAARLPDVVPSTRARAVAESAWTSALGLAATCVVVPGAGDRACEALGTGARTGCPMVSWGTTANVSVPHPGPIAALPVVAQVSRGPTDAFLIEAGLAAAGSALDWLAALTGRSTHGLWDDAASVPAGARGVHAFPWFTGARAPHWRSDATASFAGLRPDHSPAELARALVEGVAYDVARSLALLDPDGSEVVVTGGGAANATWIDVLGAVTDRTVVVRRHLEAASVGARLLAAAATGEDLTVDTLNPVVRRAAPDAVTTRTYAAHRVAADRLVAALLGAGDGSEHRP